MKKSNWWPAFIFAFSSFASNLTILPDEKYEDLKKAMIKKKIPQENLEYSNNNAFTDNLALSLLQAGHYGELKEALNDKTIKQKDVEDSNFWFYLGTMNNRVEADSITKLAKIYFRENLDQVEILVQSIRLDVQEGRTQPSKETQNLLTTVFGYSTSIVSTITYPVWGPLVFAKNMTQKAARNIYWKIFGKPRASELHYYYDEQK